MVGSDARGLKKGMCMKLTHPRGIRLAVFPLLLASMMGCLMLPLPDLSGIRERVAPDDRTPSEAVTEVVAILEATPAPSPSPISESSGGTPATGERYSLETLYERVNPSVVNIIAILRVDAQPFAPGPELPFPFAPQEPEDPVQRGEGSGFVYDREGHIITNNHVVAGADELWVTFANDVSVVATVVGTDPDSDLAVIKVDLDPSDLRPLPLADSDAIKVGQQVVAIGNPFGLQGTMTSGIISALGRLLPAGGITAGGGRYTIPDIIQTDAAINPGNSGGPLLNLQGQVIGVNTAIESPVQGSSGVGFAVPASMVRKVTPLLIEQGYYQHPWLGASLLILDPSLDEALKLPTGQRGVLIVGVTEGSPAERAGLRPAEGTVQAEGESLPTGGDIIIAIDGDPVNKFDDLISYLIRRTEVGQRVRLSILREGELHQVDVTLAARPKTD